MMQTSHDAPYHFEATAHLALAERYGFWNLWLTMAALSLTAVSLCFTLVTDEFALQALRLDGDRLKLLNAVIGLTGFVCVLVQLVWKPDAKETAHVRAAKHYSEVAGREPVAGAATHVQSLPPIPTSQFLKLKRFYAQRLAILELLESGPKTETFFKPEDADALDCADKSHEIRPSLRRLGRTRVLQPERRGARRKQVSPTR